MIIAPLSLNTLSKMAHGACDNLLLATYFSVTCPVVVAPAMDEDMWHHPAAIANLDKLRSFGNSIVPVEKGELASGLYGDGRMAEPETIAAFIQDAIFKQKDLSGKKVMVTAGPTYEQIDPVRFIGNHSSGKMGIALSRELAGRGADVTLIIGPTSECHHYHPDITIQHVQSADDMYKACVASFAECDIAVMAAAVADFTPVTVAPSKIKKTDSNLVIELTKTRDILKSLGQEKKNGQILVGFALETDNEREYALKKMAVKNADMIVLNSLKDAGAGFGFDTNKITIFEKDGRETVYEQKSKQQVAKDIVDKIVNMLYA
jgi:phosphopantothenoylcysteine decarboxylase/phosphopantothenate--cysteine ligase